MEAAAGPQDGEGDARVEYLHGGVNVVEEDGLGQGPCAEGGGWVVASSFFLWWLGHGACGVGGWVGGRKERNGDRQPPGGWAVAFNRSSSIASSSSSSFLFLWEKEEGKGVDWFFSLFTLRQGGQSISPPSSGME